MNVHLIIVIKKEINNKEKSSNPTIFSSKGENVSSEKNNEILAWWQKIFPNNFFHNKIYPEKIDFLNVCF